MTLGLGLRRRFEDGREMVEWFPDGRRFGETGRGGSVSTFRLVLLGLAVFREDRRLLKDDLGVGTRLLEAKERPLWAEGEGDGKR